MRTRVQKWGNSLGIRIPKTFANEIGLTDHSPVEISIREGELVIEPIQKTDVSLDQLLERITPDNLHIPIETGPAQGNEAW